ncbi:MAG: DUF4340 domain-containing protein [Bacteroidales bacterium]|nr:DUF4340 domain-containing protein [Bacteroidales bacterium]
MFNKIKTNQLLAVFLVLLVAVLITAVGGNKKKTRSFLSELTDIDTSAVTALTIYSAGNEDPVVLERQGNNWVVVEGATTHNADNSQAEEMLNTLADLTSTRLAATEKDRWENYEVTDSLATRVEVKAGKKVAAELYIGKFSYSQPPQQAMSPYGGRQQGTMTSYVRLAGEKEIYAVEGFLRMMFNRSAGEFRDRTVLQVPRKEVSRIALQLPGEQFSLSRSENKWMVDGLMADSAAVAGYLSGLARLTSSAFLEDASLVSGTPTHTLLLEDANGARLGEVNAWFRDSTDIAITSSVNPGTIFDGTQNDLFEKVVQPRAAFLPGE